MARTEVDLANAALAYLQRDPNLRSLDGVTPPVVQTKQHMQNAIEEVIEEYDWPFCRVVTSLVAIADTTIPLRGWSYLYQVPSDAVIIWRVSDLRGNVLEDYEMGMSDDVSSDTNYIYTSSPDLAVRYGSRRVGIARFPAQVFDLMATKLAIKCCMALTKDKALFQYLRGEYTKNKSAVITKFANLEPEVRDVDETPELITVRSQ